MSKKIGIPTYRLGANSFGVTAPYIEFIKSFGEPVLLDVSSEIRKDLDLLILPGGPDIDSSRYGEAPGVFTQSPSTALEYFDKVHLPEYIKNKTPIFGICRGMQSLWVYFGGKLVQHMHQPSNSDDDRSDLVHKVFETNGSRESLPFTPDPEFLKKKGEVKVNSMHHQCGDMNHRPDDIIVDYISSAWHRGNYITVPETIRHETLPIAAVQWHPKSLGLN